MRSNIMAAPRRMIELTIGEEDLAQLMSIARSRTEPASRVERARILLAYRDTPSFYAVGRALGMHPSDDPTLRRAGCGMGLAGGFGRQSQARQGGDDHGRCQGMACVARMPEAEGSRLSA